MWWRRVGWFVLLWFAGISVVGIDNGFGAAMAIGRMLRVAT